MDKKISKLHYITGQKDTLDHSDMANEACKGGIDWVQLRIKNRGIDEIRKEAVKTKEICHKHGATFIINDNTDLALEIKADGIHLGKSDMHPLVARKLLGNDAIIGATANTFADIKQLVSFGVDYIGLGPFRFTKTKENLSPILGTEGYSSIIEKCRMEGINIPIIAIGGILPDDKEDILNTGVHGLAVSSVITMSENIQDTISKLKQ